MKAAAIRSAEARNGGVLTTTEAATVLGVHERTLRRYLSSGLLAYRRLPGGHYRIPEEAVAEFWRENEKGALHTRHRTLSAERGSDAQRSNRRRGTRLQSSQRRLRLGEESPTASYDLSTAALAALRSRLS